jgi:hypothetical protein
VNGESCGCRESARSASRDRSEGRSERTKHSAGTRREGRWGRLAEGGREGRQKQCEVFSSPTHRFRERALSRERRGRRVSSSRAARPGTRTTFPRIRRKRRILLLDCVIATSPYAYSPQKVIIGLMTSPLFLFDSQETVNSCFSAKKKGETHIAATAWSHSSTGYARLILSTGKAPEL